ncbi:MAG: phage tail protein [Acidobacteria bacterium]|nr:phage tail protein [Acidobacteriota bacterium]
MSETWVPPPAFYFGLVVGGSSTSGGSGSASTALDASFQQVRGIEMQITVEEVGEGGENRFFHRLPGRVRYPNLVLERGLVTTGSFLAAWCAETVGGNYVTPVEPRMLQLSLFGADGWPRVTWMIDNAYPVKWKLGPLNARKNTFAVETLELAYNAFWRADWD